MKTLLCEQAGRGSLRYLLFEDAEGGMRRYSVLIEQRECDRSELLRDVADSLPEALARVAEYRLAGRTPQGNSVGRTAGCAAGGRGQGRNGPVSVSALYMTVLP